MRFTEMKVVNMTPVWVEEDLLAFIGQIAGECYNSSKDTDKCIKRALGCIKRGHHSPWEHFNITLKCTVDRGTSHALVRHRHCAFQQSSTIYQKYDELVFIEPNTMSDTLTRHIEQEYLQLIDEGNKPGEARDCLPNCLATNLIITTNVRQWMYMLQRRCGPGDSDKMHHWCELTRKWFAENYPQITSAFDAWYINHPL